MTQQYRLASMAPWLSSTGISHHNLLPHIPSIRLSTVNSSPRTRIAPQSLNSSSQLLRLPEDQRSCPVYVWLWQGLSDPFHLSCHRSAVSLSALNASPLTQTIALMWGRDLFQFSHPLRAGPVLLTLLFFPRVPSSYRVLRGSIRSFPLVRSSCPLSAGVLDARLRLRCIPDVSLETDVLHVHLLLRHLVPYVYIFSSY